MEGVDLYQGLERVQQVAIPTFLAYGMNWTMEFEI